MAADVPRRLTQRGHRRQTTIFSADFDEPYRELLAAWCRCHGVAVGAWRLMPSRVHLLLRPTDAAGLRLALGEGHRRYTRAVDRRHDRPSRPKPVTPQRASASLTISRAWLDAAAMAATVAGSTTAAAFQLMMKQK